MQESRDISRGPVTEQPSQENIPSCKNSVSRRNKESVIRRSIREKKKEICRSTRVRGDQ